MAESSSVTPPLVVPPIEDPVIDKVIVNDGDKPCKFTVHGAYDYNNTKLFLVNILQLVDGKLVEVTATITVNRNKPDPKEYTIDVCIPHMNAGQTVYILVTTLDANGKASQEIRDYTVDEDCDCDCPKK